MPTTTTTVTGQQSIPTELMPYFTGAGTAGSAGYVPGLLPKAQEVFSKDYATVYKPMIDAGLTGAGGIASLTPTQQQVGSEIRQMTAPDQFNMGTGAAGSAYGALSGLPSMLDEGMMQRYMSPYTQGVVDVQQRQAIEDAQKANLANNLSAARQGSYGGSRQLLSQLERERGLRNQLGDIQAKGLQSAYEAAQKGLEAERTSRLQQGTALTNLGQTFGQLGTMEQAADIDRLKTMGAYGDLERAYEQQLLDARKADFLNQMNFPTQQLGSMADILRGVPISKIGESTSVTTPPPSLASQLGGMALSGLSLMNFLSK
jgi:hypothetical protein